MISRALVAARRAALAQQIAAAEQELAQLEQRLDYGQRQVLAMRGGAQELDELLALCDASEGDPNQRAIPLQELCP